MKLIYLVFISSIPSFCFLLTIFITHICSIIKSPSCSNYFNEFFGLRYSSHVSCLCVIKTPERRSSHWPPQSDHENSTCTYLIVAANYAVFNVLWFSNGACRSIIRSLVMKIIHVNSHS